MSSKKPHVTPDFALVSFVAHRDRETAILNVGALAKLTGSSKSYWRKLRAKNQGPKCFAALGDHWYYLADIQDWLGVTVSVESEARRD